MVRMNQTLNEAAKNHKKLWEGIAANLKRHGIITRNVVALKDSTVKELFPNLRNQHVSNNCFLCDFAAQRSENGNVDCRLCPMVREEPQDCLMGLFDMFCTMLRNDETESAALYAERIARLPIINPLYGKDGAENGLNT